MVTGRCAVLLRGIAVGRGDRPAMAGLRAARQGVGCTDVSTYLNSGNAVVTDPDGLAARVERALPLRVDDHHSEQLEDRRQ